MSEEADRIRAATAELEAAVNSSNVARVLSLWSEDGVMMPPYHPAVQGRAAIERYFTERFAIMRYQFSVSSTEIQLAGDIALERVAYSVVARPVSSGDIVEVQGKGLHVYRRQSDRSWKLAIDIWNSDRP